MELLAAALTEPFRLLFESITDRVKNQFKIHSNFKELEEIMNPLYILKQDLDEYEALLYTPRPGVGEWSKRVGALKNKFDAVKAGVTANGEFGCIRSLDCKLSSNIVRWLEEAKKLIATGTGFQNIPAPERVEPIPGPSVVGQATASRNLEELMKLLGDDGVRKIGVWGMGGVGKTTLVQNLNNRLEKSEEKLFSVVIWVVVSNHGTLETIQRRIAERLGMTIQEGEGEERVCYRLCSKLKEGRFLLILDDLWNKVDLDKVGIPRLDQNLIGSKIIITSRSVGVCNSMGTDQNFKVLHLSDEEAWELFAENVGDDVVNKEEIKPLAEGVVKECHGLPLALTAVGASMRKQMLISRWEDALDHFLRSRPVDPDVEKQVFDPLKWSYDCLEEPLKACFLFFCLFPEDYEFDVDSLVQYWLAEGLLDEDRNYKGLHIQCDTLVHRLKDSCLLESGIHDPNGVRMHDVVRDVGIWIATSSENEFKSIVRAGAGAGAGAGILKSQILQQHLEGSTGVKRVSFMNNGIKSLPNCEVHCPETSTLFLQYNPQLDQVPYSFLKGFQTLKILDLSGSAIQSLPHSLVDLGQLRALFLRECKCLSELPPLAALEMLQVLDCSFSGITKLPQGFEKLTNLRQLNLSHTRRLESNPAEKILSKLCSLEYLNMMDSDTKCGFGKEDENEIQFQELLDLNHLMVLRIDLQGIPNVTKRDVSKFQRIKDVRVKVYFEGLNFSGDELVEWMLRDAVYCKIYVCKGVELMLGSQVRNNASFANLVHLALRNCCISVKTSSLGQSDLMPNLERLQFYELSGLESISDFSNFLGLRFTKLRMMYVEGCHHLEHLLEMDNGIILQHLEDIFIVDCQKLVQVFKNTSSCIFAPKLKHMTLDRLPELVAIFKADDVSLCESLKNLKVTECHKLQKLPSLGTQHIEIEGNPDKWWDKLELAIEWDCHVCCT